MAKNLFQKFSKLHNDLQTWGSEFTFIEESRKIKHAMENNPPSQKNLHAIQYEKDNKSITRGQFPAVSETNKKADGAHGLAKTDHLLNVNLTFLDKKKLSSPWN